MRRRQIWYVLKVLLILFARRSKKIFFPFQSITVGVTLLNTSLCRFYIGELSDDIKLSKVICHNEFGLL